MNYAMTRTFPNLNSTTGEGEKEYHLIYDSGAMSTTASVMAFYQTSYLPTPKSKTSINTTHVELLGTGWQEVGGVMLDLTIQEVLAADFVQKSGKVNVRDDKRAMAKLHKEAVRVKHILSANQESRVNVSYRQSTQLTVRLSPYTTISITRPNSAVLNSKPSSLILATCSCRPSDLHSMRPVSRSMTSPR